MSNPALNADRWAAGTRDGDMAMANRMTIEGAVTKTIILVVIMLGTIGVMWSQFWHGGDPDVKGMMPWLIGGAIGGLVLALIGMFAHRTAVIVAPLYAVAEGIFLGGLTMVFSKMYPGIAESAAVYTLGVLFGMLMMYKMGVIKATAGFKRGVMIATAGLAIGTLALWVLGMFGIGQGISHSLYGNGWMGIAFSLFCIGLAALNLVVDFAFIEEAAEKGAPKHYEWVGAFALLVTMVWLYIEILRLLAKLRGGSDD
jgi:uncharacterized YccA/Bax inhibitor family protein